MADVVRIIRIRLEEQENGLLCATSPDLPGMIVMHREAKRIREDLPNVIKLIFKQRYDMNVEVREAATRDEDPRAVPNWVAIPSRVSEDNLIAAE